MTDSGEVVQDSQPIPTKFPIIDYYVANESILRDDESGRVLVVLGSTSTVFAYDRDLGFKGAVLHRFPGQKIPNQDVNPNAAGGALAGLRHLFGREDTLTYYAGNLGGGKVLMQHEDILNRSCRFYRVIP